MHVSGIYNQSQYIMNSLGRGQCHGWSCRGGEERHVSAGFKEATKGRGDAAVPWVRQGIEAGALEGAHMGLQKGEGGAEELRPWDPGCA